MKIESVQDVSERFRAAEWAAEVVDTLAKVGVRTEDLPGAIRAVARLENRVPGTVEAAETVGITYAFIFKSPGEEQSA